MTVPLQAAIMAFSYIVNLLLRELIGLVEVDSKKKTARFSDETFDIDCEVRLPVGDRAVLVTVKDGKREISDVAG